MTTQEKLIKNKPGLLDLAEYLLAFSFNTRISAFIPNDNAVVDDHTRILQRAHILKRIPV